MNVVVTGSRGYIGSALIERLKQLPINVVWEIDKKNNTDVLDINADDYKNVDYVIHLAAQTSVFNNNLNAIIRDNIIAFKKIVDFANEKDAKLIYASSSCAANITSLYGISKKFNEEYAKIYCNKATGIRFHNVYSDKPRKGTLLYNLLNEEEPKIYNNGKNVRHFTHISDIIDGIIFAFSTSLELINVYNPVKNTVMEFCTEVSNHVKLNKLQYVSETLKYDKVEQIVDENVYIVPLDYKGIKEGLTLSLKNYKK